MARTHASSRPSAVPARDLERSPSWRDRAACHGEDLDLFYPDKGPATEARLICSRCPVTAECLEDALEMGDRFGVRGGLSPDERTPLHKARAALTRPWPTPPRKSPGPVEHGTRRGYDRGCSCVDCRAAKAAGEQARRARAKAKREGGAA